MNRIPRSAANAQSPRSTRSTSDGNAMRKLRWQTAMKNNALLKQLAERGKHRVKPILAEGVGAVTYEDDDEDDDHRGSDDGRVETLLEERAKLLEKCSSLERRNEKLARDVQRLDGKGEVVDDLNDRCRELTEENERLSGELARLKVDKATYKERYVGTEMENAKLQDLCEKLKAGFKKMEKKIEQQRQQIHSEHEEEEKIVEWEEKCNKLAKSNEKLRAELAKLKDTRPTEEESRRLKDTCETLKADLKKLEVNERKLEQKNEELRGQIEQRQKLDKKYGEVEEWMARCKELVLENEQLRIELANLEEGNATWMARYEALDREHEKLRDKVLGDEQDYCFDDAIFVKTVVFLFLMFLIYCLFSFSMGWMKGAPVRHSQFPW